MKNFKKVSAISPLHTGGSFRRTDKLYTTSFNAVLSDGRPIFTSPEPVIFDFLDGSLVTATGSAVCCSGYKVALGSEAKYLRAHGGHVVVGTLKETIVFDRQMKVLHRRRVRAGASVLAGGEVVVGTTKGEIHFLDQGRVKRHGTEKITGLVYLGRLYSSSLDGSVVIWDVTPLAVDIGEPVVGMDLSGGHVMVLTQQRLYRLESGRPIDTGLDILAGCGSGPGMMACPDPFESRVAFKEMRDGVIVTTENELYDTSTSQFLIGNNDEVTDLKYQASRGLVVCTNSGRLRVYAEALHVVQSHEDSILGYSVAARASFSRESVVVYDEKLVPRLKIRLHVSSVDGDSPLFVASGGAVHCIGLGEAELKSCNCSHECVYNPRVAQIGSRPGTLACFSWEAHAKEVTSVAVSGVYVATSSLDKAVKLWTRDAKLLGVGHHRKGVNCLLICGESVVSADSCIKTWSMPGMELVRTIDHNVPILSLGAGDGLLFAGDSLGVVRVYREGKLVFQMEDHKDRVWTVIRFAAKLSGLPPVLGATRLEGGLQAGAGDAEAFVWATGGADGVINFYVDNTEEHALFLKQRETEKKEAENTVALLLKSNDLRRLVTVLLERGDERADVYLRKLFYEARADSDCMAFFRSLDRAKLVGVIRRLARRVKNAEVCHVLARHCRIRARNTELGALLRRQKKAVDEIYLEMLSYRLFFKEFCAF